MRIGIGSDHRGYKHKEVLKSFLSELGHDVHDYGTHSEESCDYPDFAIPLARDVASGKMERGILICNTGIGMCITANKVKGVYAALVTTPETAESARRHNNSNVLVMGASLNTPDEMKKMVDIWLRTPFEGGRHERRINKIKCLENEN